MDIQVLGCSGGIGVDLRTTTLLIDDDILIDAGTGVGDLSIEQMAKLRHIFVTHSHLDHIAFIPLLIDTLFDQVTEPLIIHAQPATLKALKNHIFNNVIWPDFSKLPSIDNPVMCFQEMNPGEVFSHNERHIEMIKVNHIVPGVGYCIANSTSTFAFSGDTCTNDLFWERLNQYEKLDVLIVETAFPNSDIVLSRQAGHYCASLLADDLLKLKHKAEVYISHNKPGAETQIIAECKSAITSHSIHSLSSGQKFKL